MDSETVWKRLVGAAAEPAGMGSDRQRLRLLSDAMLVGGTITRESVGCSVTETLDSGFRTPVASGRLARELDDAQYRAGEGPCIAACHDGQVHGIRVMAGESSYPGFTHEASRQNVASSLSVPLAGPTRASALNLYAGSPRAFDPPRARAVAMLLARCVGAILAADPVHSSIMTRRPVIPDVTAASSPSELDPQRRQVAALVEQALDALHLRHGFDRTQAFAELTRRSRNEGRGMVAVCRDIARVPRDDAGWSA